MNLFGHLGPGGHRSRLVRPRGLRPIRAVRSLWHRALRHRSTPHDLALGAAVGAFIGVSPLWGLHTWIALATCALAPVNRLTVVLGTLSGNPWTFLPIVGASFWIGGHLHEVAGFGPIEYERILRGLDGPKDLLRHVSGLALPYLVGGFLLSLLAMPVAYAVTRGAVVRVRRRRADRRRASPWRRAVELGTGEGV